MKKGILVAASIALFANAQAQNIGKVKDLIDEKNFTAAKAEMDELIKKPESAKNSEWWYYKGVIENMLSHDAKTIASCADCKFDAFQSFKKYMELDKNAVLMLANNNVQLFDLYNGFLDEGGKAYNAEKIDVAFDQFTKGLQVHDYIVAKKLDYNGTLLNAIDTSLISNTAICALNSGKNLEAIALYNRLMDANAATEDMANNCGILANNTFIAGNKKEAADFNAACSRYFKNNQTFKESEVTMMDPTNKIAIFQKYETLIADNAKSYRLHYNYMAELFNYVHTNSSISDDEKTKYKTRFQEIAKATDAIEHQVSTVVLLAKHYYNSSYDYQEAGQKIKGTDKESTKQKDALRVLQMAAADQTIQYGLDAEKELLAAKVQDAESLKSIYGILSSIYNLKNDVAKTKEYQAKKDAMK
jgi:hypothetical protein